MITTEGPGLSPGRLDAIDAARPRLVRQIAPGVYTIVDMPPCTLTPAEHMKRAAWCKDAADTMRIEAAKERDYVQAAKFVALAMVYDLRVAVHQMEARGQ